MGSLSEISDHDDLLELVAEAPSQSVSNIASKSVSNKFFVTMVLRG